VVKQIPEGNLKLGNNLPRREPKENSRMHRRSELFMYRDRMESFPRAKIAFIIQEI